MPCSNHKLPLFWASIQLNNQVHPNEVLRSFITTEASQSIHHIQHRHKHLKSYISTDLF